MQATIAVEVRSPRSLPIRLARVHQEVPAGSRIRLLGPPPGAAAPDPAALLEGGGFSVHRLSTGGDGRWTADVTRARTLPDTVGPGMRVLVCGLNPSEYSADAGVGFARPGNRFWPAALAAGLVTEDRDPWHALEAHRVGMTDLVKRATPASAALGRQEYRDGFARLERLAEWLRPGIVLFVGLEGWRAAVDRTAAAGPQGRTVGGRPAHVMPSTSGRNASSRLEDLVSHLQAVAAAGAAAGRTGQRRR
ncbi:MAG: mismatch-specific DNA-glycosylase [Acidimicrobiales bacterium]|jgi:TDG/mug DNA glycosylase family protein|nr:mismatch-specific DNA-glycosylase [Acidimicrobiales bacterium]